MDTSCLLYTSVKGLGCLQDKRYDDVFNVRVITRNGKLTSEEQKKVAEAAEKFGSGEVTMTTRLTLEIQGVPYDNLDNLLSLIHIFLQYVDTIGFVCLAADNVFRQGFTGWRAAGAAVQAGEFLTKPFHPIHHHDTFFHRSTETEYREIFNIFCPIDFIFGQI